MEDFNAFWDAQLVDFVHSLHVLKDSRLVKFLCFFKNFLENWLVDFFSLFCCLIWSKMVLGSTASQQGF